MEDLSGFFAENGYLVVRNKIDPEELVKLKAEFARLVEEVPMEELTTIFTSGENQIDEKEKSGDYFLESSDKIRFFLEEKAFDRQTKSLTVPKSLSVNKVGHALYEHNEVFKRFTQLPANVAVAQALGLRAPLVVQSMYITKQPHVGGEVTPHQDSSFIYTTPETCIAFWWPVEAATITNSCIWVIPGSHNVPLKTRMLRSEKKELTFEPALNTLTWPSDDQYIPVEVNAGDIVVLHGRIIHKSGENKSDHSRHAYTIHMTEADSAWDAKNWLQRDSPFPTLYK